MKRSGPLARRTRLGQAQAVQRDPVQDVARRQAAAGRRADRAEFLANIAELAGAVRSDAGGGLEVAPTRPVRRRGRTTDAPPEARAVVHARARLRCERCARDLAWGGGQIHHRRPRRMGGSRALDVHGPSNLLLLCLGCHEWVERNRAVATAQGLLVAGGGDHAAVPALLWVGLRLLHAAEARYVDIDA